MTEESSAFMDCTLIPFPSFPIKAEFLIKSVVFSGVQQSNINPSPSLPTPFSKLETVFSVMAAL